MPPEHWVNMLRFPLLLLLVMSSFEGPADTRAQEVSGEIAYPFFAFENGVKYPTCQQRVDALKAMGYDGIGSASPRDLKARLPVYDKAGLKIFSIYVGGNLAAAEPVVSPAIRQAIADLKGRETVVELFVQGGRGASDERAVEFVQAVADLAAASRLRVVLYPHTGFYVDTLGDAVRIAKLCDRKNVGVMFNLCHFLNVERGADLPTTLSQADGLLWRISVSGADVDGAGWATLIQPLDQGDFDQVELLKELRKIGFHGAVGLQCFGIREPSSRHLSRSIKAWAEFLQEANERP